MGVAKIDVVLRSETVAAVDAAAADGDYFSRAHVVEEALRLWREEQRERAAAIARVRALIDEGIASGPGRGWTLEEFLQEGRRRLKADYDAAGLPFPPGLDTDDGSATTPTDTPLAAENASRRRTA